MHPSLRNCMQVCPAIEELAAQLEGCWRGVLPEDQFGLYPLEERYKYLDSLDPEGTQPFSYKGMPVRVLPMVEHPA